jgi:hypothetical protein
MLLQLELFNRVDPITGENHIDEHEDYTFIKLGPIIQFQWTYSHLRLVTETNPDYIIERYNNEAIIYKGMFFGDFRIVPFNELDKEVEALEELSTYTKHCNQIRNNMKTNKAVETEKFTEEINDADVISVAERLKMSVSIDEIHEVLKRYDSEANNDPTGTWDLIVENLLYNIKETTK